MSSYVKTESACGRSFGWVDIFDLPLNPHGVQCCNDCYLIITSRDAWMDENGDYIPTITRLSAVPSDDPWYVRP